MPCSLGTAEPTVDAVGFGTLKVLFAAHQLFPESRAGVEVVTLGLARELKTRGHEPFILAAKRTLPHSDLRPGQTEDYEFEGVPVRRVGRPEEGLSRPYRLNYRNDVMARKVREYVREVGPHIIHAMHLQGLSASVLPVFKEFGLPVVFTAADFWSVCPVVDLRRHDGVMCEGPEVSHCVRCIASRGLDPRVKKAAALIPGVIPKVADLMSRTSLSRFSFPLRQVGAVRERPAYIKEQMQLVDQIVAYTRLTRDLLVTNGIGAGKIRVSHYGIDTSHIADISSMRTPSATLRFGFVGTLAPHKGPDLLVRAFRRLPSETGATLSIHGSEKGYEFYTEGLRALAGDDGRISFRGAFSREELPGVLSRIDVLVVPSRWYENAPGVVFEAFAAGIPAVTTDLGGMSEFVRHEKNGLLFELENAEDLARQLWRLTEEPGLLAKLRAGIGPVKTVADYTDELEALYTSLLEGR
jgi:glycosyltransferase involved in cell wall biosynthesis